jgi:hypothetical protein
MGLRAFCGGLVAGFRPVCSDGGKSMVAERLARVSRSRVIALAISSAVLLLLVLCLSMGAVSGKADETATRMFEHHMGESAIRLNGGLGVEAEPRSVVLGWSPAYRPRYRHGVERVDGRVIAVRGPRPSNPELN